MKLLDIIQQALTGRQLGRGRQTFLPLKRGASLPTLWKIGRRAVATFWRGS